MYIRLAASARSRSADREVPKAIEAGYDVFLSNINLEEDVTYMRTSLTSGLLSIERLNEAVTRGVRDRRIYPAPQIRKPEARSPTANHGRKATPRSHRWNLRHRDHSRAARTPPGHNVGLQRDSPVPSRPLAIGQQASKLR
jgi:beta-glucosidase-like glycosyl hydrolase